MRFDLYLESGPQHRKTWIYAPGLPGCSTVSPMSDQAVEYARAAITERLAFLRRHGESTASFEPIEPVVAAHTIERKFLGFGQLFVPTDLAPVTTDEAASQLLWASWSREELVAAAKAIAEPLAVKPASGRSAAAILSHVAGSEWSYVSSTLGTLPGYAPAIAAIELAGEEPWEALASERETVMERLRAMTAAELAMVKERDGKPPLSARRLLRRFLEHEWEHVLELRARVAA